MLKKFMLTRKSGVLVSLAAGAAVLSGSANAVLDASIATGLTSLQTDFSALLSLVYPVMIAITVALVIFGLVKGFIKKAGGN